MAAALRTRDMVPRVLDRRHAPIEFRHGRLDLLLADGVGGVLELAGQFGPGEAKRLAGTQLFGVHTGSQTAAPLLMLTRVELFLQSGFSVDEPFTSITHSVQSSLSGLMTGGQRERITKKRAKRAKSAKRSE